ncbi:hypothetical protein L6R50_10670 [Myxococcota bacterium]|nr:hypothetical protein [Myxococcota bacterium]
MGSSGRSIRGPAGSRPGPGAWAALALLALALAGCPTLRIGDVGVSNATARGFTLTAAVVVEETEDPTEPDGKPAEGRGILALHLPRGWDVTAARVAIPGEGLPRALIPSPQGAATFAESFPTAPGEWWAFTAPPQKVPKGTHTYPIELDVTVPKRTRGGPIGIAASVLEDKPDDLPAPREYLLTLAGKKASLEPAPPQGG